MNRKDILNKFSPSHDNILVILHELQNNNPEHYLSNDDLRAVADFLNTTLSHVYGVATYYSMYSLVPRGRFIIRVCNSPVCNMQGSEEVIAELKRLLDIGFGGTTTDGRFTLELTECLGQCSGSPTMMVNEDVHTHLSVERISRILDHYKTR